MLLIVYELKELDIAPDLTKLTPAAAPAYIPEYVDGLEKCKTDDLEREFLIWYLDDLVTRLEQIRSGKYDEEPQTVADQIVPPTPTETQPKRRIVKVRKYNCPKGVEFSEEIGGYYVSITLCGEPITTSPSRDLDSVIQMRDAIAAYARAEVAKYDRSDSDGRRALVSTVREMISAGAFRYDQKQDQPVDAVVSASIDALPSPVEDVEMTPRNSDSPPLANAGRTTPMSVPHRVSSAKENVDVLRFRDKFYARLSVFGDFVNTPMRLTKSEAEADVAAISHEIEKEQKLVETDPSRMISAIDSIRLLIASIATAPSQPVSHASTPQPDKKGGLPPYVKQNTDGSFYGVLNLFGNSFNTPQRNQVDQVVDDRSKIDIEVKRLRSLMSASKNRNRNNPNVIKALDRFITALGGVSTPKHAPVHRIRDKYYTTIDVLGSSLTTPLRTSAAEVEIDRELAELVLKTAQKQNISRDVIMQEIKNRWINGGSEERTPVKGPASLST